MYKRFIILLFLLSQVFINLNGQSCTASNAAQFMTCYNNGNTTVIIANNMVITGDLDLSGINIDINNGKEIEFTGTITVNATTQFFGGGAAKITSGGTTACFTNCGAITFAELNANLQSGQYTTLFEALTGANQVLPVEFASFSVRHLNAFFVFDWKTANELNNDFFEIEMSNDSESFNPIARVVSKGNSNNTQSYNHRIALTNAGLYYFRIKQTDFDGSFTFSQVVAIDIELKEGCSLRSNIAHETIYLDFEKPEVEVQLCIYDLNGRLITRKIERNQEQASLDVRFLEDGFYLIQAEYDGRLFTEQFVKM